MKIFQLSLIILFCVILYPAYSQSGDLAIKKYYEENAIYWLGNYKYMKNSQKYPLKNLSNEFKFSMEATALFNDFKKTNRLMVGCLVLSTGFLLSAILVKDQRLKLGFLGGSVVVAAFAIPLTLKFSRQINQSIWLYNRDILLK